MLKDRLAAAALMIDRSGDHFTMEVRQGGVKIKIMRVINNTWHFADNYTGWRGIEEATQNPLLQSIRDLTNQMNELEERKTC